VSRREPRKTRRPFCRLLQYDLGQFFPAPISGSPPSMQFAARESREAAPRADYAGASLLSRLCPMGAAAPIYLLTSDLGRGRIQEPQRQERRGTYPQRELHALARRKQRGAIPCRPTMRRNQNGSWRRCPHPPPPTTKMQVKKELVSCRLLGAHHVQSGRVGVRAIQASRHPGKRSIPRPQCLEGVQAQGEKRQALSNKREPCGDCKW
jgi:hypothetical protein